MLVQFTVWVVVVVCIMLPVLFVLNTLVRVVAFFKNRGSK